MLFLTYGYNNIMQAINDIKASTFPIVLFIPGFLRIFFIFIVIFSLFRARFYAAEIASAIGYLHSLQIIYRLVRLRCCLRSLAIGL